MAASGAMRPLAGVFQVAGEQGISEILVHRAPLPVIETCPAKTILFFMGDHVEAAHGAVARLNNAQGIVGALDVKFPLANLVVVHPSQYDDGCFACYSNFLPKMTRSGDALGHDPAEFRALRHIKSILDADISQDSNKLPELVFLGFSKGGVVLNQLVTEMAHLQDMESQLSSEAPSTFPVEDGHCSTAGSVARAVRSIHYLDVGSNGRGAYITDPRVLTSISHLATQQDLKLHFHGTPRQWQDPRRPWIADEKNRCLKQLRELNASAEEHFYFEGRKRNMDMHFEIINMFHAREK
mmetsp:Transcript_22162/g.42287  ORF Transcript_22162/g.42287 Transcript_22162/m.42287 type:complete len:296 (+) Transcript_22162:286-1173(+)